MATRVWVLVLLAISVGGTLATPASLGGRASSISLDEARSMLQAGLDAMAAVPGLRQCIVVLDSTSLKAAACADNTLPIAQSFAIEKAKTAALFGAAYNSTVEAFLPGGSLYKLDAVLSLTNVGGSVPVFDENNTIRGSIGVSGANTAQQDLDIALAALGGAGRRVAAADFRVPAALQSPFLADSVQRLAAGESAAASSNNGASLAIYNDAGRYVLFYRLDHALMGTLDFALGLAHTAAITQMNTSDLARLAAPGSRFFTFDNSNQGLFVVPGGLVLRNAAGRVIGGVGVATGASPALSVSLAEACLTAAARPAIPTIMETSIPMSSAVAAANAVLAAAAAQGAYAVVVVAGRDAVPRLVAATDGSPTAAIRIAIKKAQTAVYLPFPTPTLNSIVRPGVVYDIAGAQGGLVTYSGVSPLSLPGVPLAGGIGVVTDGALSLDDTLAQLAASSTLTGLTAPSLVIPPAPLTLPIRNGAAVTLSALHQTCDVAVANLTGPAVCAARDGAGALRYLMAADALAPAVMDFAISSSLTSLGVLEDPSQLQSQLSPFLNETTGEGTLFSLENAGLGQRSVTLPGATTLIVDSAVVGSLAVSSGFSNPASDENAALAAAKALPSFFTGPPACPAMGTLRVVDAYLTQLFVRGNVSGAALLTAGANFTLTWHGPTNLVPIAGTFSGVNALASFFGNSFSLVRDFHVNPMFSPDSPIPGVRTVSVDCNTVIKQWQELSVVIATGKAISNALNTVVYVVRNGLIVSADVFVDSMQYAEAFCGGQVACVNGAAGSASGGSACDMDSVLASVRGFGATIIVLIVIALVSMCYLSRQPRSNSANLGGVPYSAM